ncbi:MAG: hypothetical protein LBD47_00340 [Treponema sp.]|nr:hypothetical protein [Treponema sp.]
MTPLTPWEKKTALLAQQALVQVLQPIFEQAFSDSSYGFRPGRSAHQAIARAKGYCGEGYTYVVDLDLEKYFDTVNRRTNALIPGRVPRQSG